MVISKLWDFGTKDMKPRSIDIEVAQRLAKGVDLGALVIAALALTASYAKSDTYEVAGFLALFMVFSTLLMIRGVGLYTGKAWLNGFSGAAKASIAAAFAGGFAFCIGHIADLPLDLTWLLSWSGLSAAYFMASRAILSQWAQTRAAKGSFHQRIAIVGGGQAAEETLNLLERSQGDDFEIVGLFDDRFDNRSPESIRKHKKLGTISDLAPFAREHAIDLIIVAIPLAAETRLLQILKRLWELPVDIRISGAAGKLKLSRASYTYLGDLPLLSAFERPLSGWDDVMKSFVDKAIALAAIIALSPVMAAVALAVKWESKGPAIFKQKRFGFNNQLVEVYKFRSMYTDMSDAAASKLVTKDDPRVTRVGRIIRKTSLDELPQLFNVLKGTLSLVGPRPHATQAKAAGTLYDEVVDGYFARHKVKPGITGWAQINGWRGETDTREKIEQRVKHDLEYIDRWSLGFDLYILAKTPLALLKSENAY
jgi:Undecaprenyl-phosphate glucose phosphotransferase